MEMLDKLIEFYINAKVRERVREVVEPLLDETEKILESATMGEIPRLRHKKEIQLLRENLLKKEESK